MGTGMVMGSVFWGSHATPPRWGTSGPQFGMKAAINRPKASRIVTSAPEFLRRIFFPSSNRAGISEKRPLVFWVLTRCAALRAAGQIFFKEGCADTLDR